MSSKGIAHRKTKKHHRLNVEHWMQHKGDLPITLGSLKNVATQAPKPKLEAKGNSHYTYRVTWSDEDKEYVGLCVECPSLSWLAKTQEEALQGIRKVVAEANVSKTYYCEKCKHAHKVKSVIGKAHKELGEKK